MLGDFTVTRVIGLGGFGIVYLAHDNVLQRTVAIKEYLPITIAGRTSAKTVLVRSMQQADTFAAGLHRFMREARLQARFSHPAMLEVYQVWEQNGTAYMAMRYYPGEALHAVREDTDARMLFDEAAIRRIMAPVFEGLQILHDQNVLHRDVSPDNILILPTGAAVLLDFGSARLVVAGAEQSLTTVLKPGYAPVEQYIDDGSMVQGPWTDVYALGAVLYFLTMGTPPPQAVARMLGGTLHEFEAAANGRYSAAFINAVRASLTVQPTLRLQTIAALREALGWPNEPPADAVKSTLVPTLTLPFNAQWRAAQAALQPANAAIASTASAAFIGSIAIPACSDAVTVLVTNPVNRMAPALPQPAQVTHRALPSDASGEAVLDAIAAQHDTLPAANDSSIKKGFAPARRLRWLLAAVGAVLVPGLILFAQPKSSASATAAVAVENSDAPSAPKLKLSTTVPDADLKPSSVHSAALAAPKTKAPPVARARASAATRRASDAKPETSPTGTADPALTDASSPVPSTSTVTATVSRPAALRPSSAACQRLLSRLSPSDAAMAQNDIGQVNDCR